MPKKQTNKKATNRGVIHNKMAIIKRGHCRKQEAQVLIAASVCCFHKALSDDSVLLAADLAVD